jgi:hypothetical protein
MTGCVAAIAIAAWASLALVASAGASPLADASVSISAQTPLSFGTLIAPQSGTVDVTPDAARSASGVFTVDSNFSPALVTIVASAAPGDSPVAYSITLPPFAVLTSDSGDTIRVDNLRTVSPSRVMKPPANADTFSVGGTLHLKPNQTPGSYNAYFQVLISF